MIVITTRTPNELVIEVVQKGSTVRVKSSKEFEVILSEELTDDIIRLENSKLITYAEVNEVIPSIDSTPHRKRRSKYEEVKSNEEEKDESTNSTKESKE